MTTIKILGGGCAKCKTTYALFVDVSKDLDVEVDLEKIEDIQEIMTYDVMATPGVVIDGVVVHRGGVPSSDQVRDWLSGHN